MATYADYTFNFDMQCEYGQWPVMPAPAEPIVRPSSARTQRTHLLQGVGGAMSHMEFMPQYVDQYEMGSHQFVELPFHSDYKVIDTSAAPFGINYAQDTFHYDSPRSEGSSQSGETYSTCHVDEVYPHVVHTHHRMSIPSPTMHQDPYFGQKHCQSDCGLFSPAQSPQLPPGCGGGVPLALLQNFQDEIAPIPESAHDSAYSEPDAEGELDHDYPTPAHTEPEIKRPSRVQKEHFVDSANDSMSEDLEPEDQDDDDYNPRSSRSGNGRPKRAAASRRASTGRRSSNATSSGRVNKNKVRKPSNANLARPFLCPLAQYGCVSTFTSKNEWKRHVSTQHIKLGFWRCDMCPPGDVENPSYNDFNRKDLFTQHLRRMHRNHPLTLGTVMNDKGELEISDEAMAVHQDRCYEVLRSNPAQSTCCFCDAKFEGEGSWDERMEHVGSHMERDRKQTKPAVALADWKEDLKLRDYLEQQGLIEYDDDKWVIGGGRPLHR